MKEMKINTRMTEDSRGRNRDGQKSTREKEDKSCRERREERCDNRFKVYLMIGCHVALLLTLMHRDVGKIQHFSLRARLKAYERRVQCVKMSECEHF